MKQNMLVATISVLGYLFFSVIKDMLIMMLHIPDEQHIRKRIQPVSSKLIRMSSASGPRYTKYSWYAFRSGYGGKEFGSARYTLLKTGK